VLRKKFVPGNKATKIEVWMTIYARERLYIMQWYKSSSRNSQSWRGI